LLFAWRQRSGGFLYRSDQPSTPANSEGVRNDGLMANSGFAIVHSNDGTQQLTMDIGPYGSAFSPAASRGVADASGHGQFDLLSFELDAGGQPVIKDPGYAHKGSQEATSNHNTIDVIHAGKYVNNGAVGFRVNTA